MLGTHTVAGDKDGAVFFHGDRCRRKPAGNRLEQGMAAGKAVECAGSERVTRAAESDIAKRGTTPRTTAEVGDAIARALQA